ncbi:nuclear transport factor 2 family protein [Novosphingobium sp. P6W]|uniref:nuclear transport factor 2 family protein n=1 Tax=Novosphingobium sp. P6W TaxID=1609758 RepID=UPI001F058FB3|nr:nuclear transport factor 2 family protein [Novosphingobium sp. P6W]
MALGHLVSAYGHAIDRQDFFLLRSLYHDDAVDDHTPYYCGSAGGFVEWLPSMLANWSATAHTMIDKLFLIDGDYAEGVISARAWHLALDLQTTLVAWGRYADRYEKRQGVWRFKHRFFVLDHAEEAVFSRIESFDAHGVELGRPNGDDPIYRRLPLIGASRAPAAPPAT